MKIDWTQALIFPNWCWGGPREIGLAIILGELDKIPEKKDSDGNNSNDDNNKSHNICGTVLIEPKPPWVGGKKWLR